MDWCRVMEILNQLAERGDEVGKPLSRLGSFREKRLRDKRIYFLVYKNVLVILAIAISDKKAQQATINKILVDLSKYQKYVFDTLREKGLI